MSTAAVIRAASGGTVRRLVQSGVVLGVLVFSTAAALLAIAMLTSANQGFYDAFSAQHEAQVAVTINSAKVTAADIARTRRLQGVTETGGPYPAATITATTPGGAGGPKSRRTVQSSSITPGGAVDGKSTPSGAKAPGVAGTQGSSQAAGSTTFTVVGRSTPSRGLHRIATNPSILDGITHGQSRWPTHPGQISIAQQTSIRVPLGSAVTVASAPGKPKLTVVGYASQSVLYDGGWVAPSEIPLLRAKGAPAQEEIFYNFAHAGTSAQINADIAELKRALPAGAIASSQSYLPFEQGTGQEQAVNTPFITTFAILALALAVLIVANVVAAAVIASYRRIGVLKSIGFTPAQVAAVYLVQIGLPAVIGAVVGALLGNHWALPLIQMAPVPTKVSVPTWIDFAAPLGMLVLTGLAAAVPALRAGRLSAVQVIAAGQAPRGGHGYLPHRLAGRLPLPRPLTIGLTAPFSRPARSAITLVSITAGLTAVVLAAGLSSSIHKINHSSIQGLGQVEVTSRGVRGAVLTSRQNAAVLAALRAQPATRHYVAESDEVDGEVICHSGCAKGQPGAPAQPHLLGAAPGAGGPAPPVTIHVPGRSTQPLQVIAYDGAPSWLGWAQIAGHWYRAPDEVDASPQLLAAIHKRVGQDMTLTVNGRAVTVKIAGEVFVPNPTPQLFLSYRTLGSAAAKLGVTSYDINLNGSSDTNAYINALTRRLGTASYFVRTPAGPSIAAQIKSSYFHLLALLITVLAALGVLNSVLMATRERVHDLGVFKALGMTPRQTIAMVLCWVIAPTVIAAIIALPIGLILQDALIRHLAASSAARLILPGSFVHVLGAGELALLTLAGLGIAAAGALGPAGWAAASRTTEALRAE